MLDDKVPFYRPKGSTKIYEQAGFELSRSEDHQIVAKLNTEKLPRISSPSDPRYQRSKKLDGKLSTSRMLEEEIERLSYLLQEEQESHRRTKMERADELRELEEKIREEYENKIVLLNQEFFDQTQQQKDEFQRDRAQKAEASRLREKQVSEQLTDTQMAFEQFQAQSSFVNKLIQDEEAKKRVELENSFQKKLSSRLRDQRAHIEAETAEMLAELNSKHKAQTDDLVTQISSASEAADRLTESESKMSSLTQKVTQLKQNLADAESAIQAKRVECRAMKSKLSEIEGHHKRQLQALSSYHNTQISNLKEEIAQLRNRLIRKAEVVGEMEARSRGAMSRIHGPNSRKSAPPLEEILQITSPI
ncbi:Oidioi.mRNA.OKI2018_I69.XSR.g14456.t2.cds [Oikopleura dioica]|uniref:Oidioi.mRNA.OKI2018_I69.XSR.g14456.t2.cds n=1 Tax=Oikopleura dioica TaxID=34765 RepID=A0ABN7SH46_OIKDI|nr:Oidioi.mRNA.OKI2018_I69.XSR.g14456.t2.cds [Oikopleura dioica]